MRQFITRTLFLAMLVWALTTSASLGALDPIGGRVTWTDDVPIFRARCVECHKAGSADPMPLTTYEEVRTWASAIRSRWPVGDCAPDTVEGTTEHASGGKTTGGAPFVCGDLATARDS